MSSFSYGCLKGQCHEIFTPGQSANNILNFVLCFAPLFKESDFTVSTTLGSQKMFKDIFFVKKYHIL